ncbi:MAG: OmpA family protein [Piscinibacter sp.]|nr:OmpA family protein [Piscinibacter sp.]
MRHESRFTAPAALAATLLALGGCAMPVVAPPTVPAPVTPAQQVAPTPSAGAWTWSPQMDSAASRLRSSLRGRDVDVVQTTDQRLWLSLPGDEVFPAGRAAVSPAAAAWLDEVAQALRSVPRAEVQIVGAPDAKGGGAALALDRAASARDWMVMRGVPARRMAVSGQVPRGRNTAPNRLEILIGERTVALNR